MFDMIGDPNTYRFNPFIEMLNDNLLVLSIIVRSAENFTF